MTLEDVVAKDNSALTEEEKNFLAEHKEELTDEQKTKFGFEVPKEDPKKDENQNNKEAEGEEPVITPVVDKELEPVMASLKTGESVVVKASVLQRLEETDKAYRTEKAERIVASHVERGAIKADQLKVWTEKLMADATVEDLLKNLPDNQIMASEVGTAEGQEINATAQITQKANELVKAAREEGQTLDIGTAMSRVMASEPELAKLYQKEVTGKEGK